MMVLVCSWVVSDDGGPCSKCVELGLQQKINRQAMAGFAEGVHTLNPEP